MPLVQNGQVEDNARREQMMANERQQAEEQAAAIRSAQEQSSGNEYEIESSSTNRKKKFSIGDSRFIFGEDIVYTDIKYKDNQNVTNRVLKDKHGKPFGNIIFQGDQMISMDMEFEKGGKLKVGKKTYKFPPGSKVHEECRDGVHYVTVTLKDGTEQSLIFNKVGEVDDSQATILKDEKARERWNANLQKIPNCNNANVLKNAQRASSDIGNQPYGKMDCHDRILFAPTNQGAGMQSIKNTQGM